MTLKNKSQLIQEYKSLQEIKDPEKLYSKYNESEDYSLKGYILELITDENILFKIALKEKTLELRLSIYNRLNNRRLLKDLRKKERVFEGMQAINYRLETVSKAVSFLLED
jgi:hypothetical protein